VGFLVGFIVFFKWAFLKKTGGFFWVVIFTTTLQRKEKSNFCFYITQHRQIRRTLVCCGIVGISPNYCFSAALASRQLQHSPTIK